MPKSAMGQLQPVHRAARSRSVTAKFRLHKSPLIPPQEQGQLVGMKTHEVFTLPTAPKPAWVDALIAIVPVVAASLIGSAVTVPQIPGWYSTLVKPPFNPPNWLFAPVWTLLFAMMALSVYRITSTDGRRR